MDEQISKSKIAWYAALLLIGVPVLVLALKVVLFPVTVANTAVNSAAGVISKTLDSNNVITSYEWFYDVKAQFDSRLGQIKAHRSLVADESDAKEKSRLNIELAAMRQSCRDMATKYNANSEKVNKSLFKAKSLPETLSLTTCEA